MCLCWLFFTPCPYCPYTLRQLPCRSIVASVFSRAMASLLYACALRAENVPKKDWSFWKGSSKSDPWVKMEAGGSSCESRYSWYTQGQHPTQPSRRQHSNPP